MRLVVKRADPHHLIVKLESCLACQEVLVAGTAAGHDGLPEWGGVGGEEGRLGTGIMGVVGEHEGLYVGGD